jgi:hypothetical protein
MRTSSAVLAARAVHTYRRRDIFAYVSLRQYLRNIATLNDSWSHEIATELATDRRVPFFHVVENFKEVIEKTGEPKFRTLHIPGPNEIMAETALLAACAEAGGMFGPHPSVFSYILAKGTEKAGVFLPYFDGFKARHAAIAAACRAQLDAVVVYTDIRQFYPSISIDLALRVWRKACEQGRLAAKYAALGVKLLEDARNYQSKLDGKVGILTGPMISHLIGNLVLRDIDEDMARELPGGYFRYVDDVAIVASPGRALEMEQRLKANLERLDFHLHDQKRLETAAGKWLTSAGDFDDPPGISWMTFIGDMKRLLLIYPDAIYPLRETFQKAGLRVHPLNYSEVAQERGYLERLRGLMLFRWFRRSVRQRSGINGILAQCIFLRNDLLRELRELLSVFGRLEDYDRKRKLYRLKFLVARLLYLGSKDELREFSDAISGIVEMAMAAAVYDAVISRDVSQLLRYGPSAAQAAAQALRADGDTVSCKSVNWSDQKNVQACAIFQLNGLTVESDVPIPDSTVLRFSNWTDESFGLYRVADSYFRELGCIHGMEDPHANRWAIDTAFDRDDDLVFDIQETMQAYPY